MLRGNVFLGRRPFHLACIRKTLDGDPTLAQQISYALPLVHRDPEGKIGGHRLAIDLLLDRQSHLRFDWRVVNKARALLAARIDNFGGYDKAAAALGCTRENLYNLTSETSRKRPGIDMARAIQDALGVPMELWARRRKKAA